MDYNHRGKCMSSERELTNNMKAELKRNGIVASYQDYALFYASTISIPSVNNEIPFI